MFFDLFSGPTREQGDDLHLRVSDVGEGLHRELAEALKDSAIRNQMISTGAIVGGERPDEFAAFIRAELAKWGKVIKDAGITLR